MKEEIEQAARQSALRQEQKWFSVGRELWFKAEENTQQVGLSTKTLFLHPVRKQFGYAQDDDTAGYICRLHNTYLRLVNHVQNLEREVTDMRRLLKVKR